MYRTLPLAGVLTVTFGLALGAAACGGGDDPPQTPYQQDLVHATEACLRRAHCLHREEPDLRTCIESLTSQKERFGREAVLACTVGAGDDCPSLLACFNDGEPAAACTDPFQPVCDNTSPPVYHGCADGVEFAVVCQTGTTCDSPGGPLWPCGVAPCATGATPPSCDDVTGKLLQCEQTLLVPSSCDVGLECAAGLCIGPGEGCNTSGGMRCDGNVLTFCNQMKQATRDCAVSGHVCGVISGQPACTTGTTATACTGRGLTADCMGTTLRVCDDGNAYNFACGTSGFGCCGTGF